MTQNESEQSIDNAHMTFSDKEWLRYTRHVQLPQIGPTGQSRLKNSHVLIVGAGGLGSPVSLYLAAAGIGRITLVDGDVVDVTNLQRQILFTQNDVGHSKAARGKARLSELNADITVEAIEQHFTPDNAEDLVKQADIVMDCTDNFATRYLINDTCAKYSKPWVFASIHQFSGQCALFTQDTACFRCLFPESPTDVPDCNSAGVLGVLPGMLGIFQANEAIKFLTGLNTPLKNRLLLIEAIDLTFRQIQLSKSPSCIVCHPESSSQNEDLNAFYQWQCASDNTSDFEINVSTFDELKQHTDYQVLDVRSDAERAAFHVGGEHIVLQHLPEKLSHLDKSKIILCYCQSGVRSLKAAHLLAEQGFQVKSLQGGLAGWVKSHCG